MKTNSKKYKDIFRVKIMMYSLLVIIVVIVIKL